MKWVLTSCILVVFSGTVAEADFRKKVVSAGQTTQLAVYTAWDPVNCGNVFGVVKVTAKPQSGKLSNALINTTVPIGRFTGRPGSCFGKPTKGFAVFYTPVRGFRGTDTFTVDISWPAVNRTATDTFFVTVQ
jgi:hypothetical protein